MVALYSRRSRCNSSHSSFNWRCADQFYLALVSLAPELVSVTLALFHDSSVLCKLGSELIAVCFTSLDRGTTVIIPNLKPVNDLNSCRRIWTVAFNSLALCKVHDFKGERAYGEGYLVEYDPNKAHEEFVLAKSAASELLQLIW